MKLREFLLTIVSIFILFSELQASDRSKDFFLDESENDYQFTVFFKSVALTTRNSSEKALLTKYFNDPDVVNQTYGNATGNFKRLKNSFKSDWALDEYCETHKYYAKCWFMRCDMENHDVENQIIDFLGLLLITKPRIRNRLSKFEIRLCEEVKEKEIFEISADSLTEYKDEKNLIPLLGIIIQHLRSEEVYAQSYFLIEDRSNQSIFPQKINKIKEIFPDFIDLGILKRNTSFRGKHESQYWLVPPPEDSSVSKVVSEGLKAANDYFNDGIDKFAGFVQKIWNF